MNTNEHTNPNIINYENGKYDPIILPYSMHKAPLSENPVSNHRIISKKNKMLVYYPGAEIPLYLYSDPHRLSISKGIVDMEYIYYFTYPKEASYRSFGNGFEELFKSAPKLHKIVIKDTHTYYVAKGTLLMDDFTPLIQITHNYDGVDSIVTLENDSRNIKMLPEKMKVYINKIVHTPKFNVDHRLIYNKIMRYFLPKLVYLKSPVVYFRKLDLWREYDEDSFMKYGSDIITPEGNLSIELLLEDSIRRINCNT